MDFNKLKVVELKAELSKLGLSTAGLKAQLVERLDEFQESRKTKEITEAAVEPVNVAAVEEVKEPAVAVENEEKVENDKKRKIDEDAAESDSKAKVLKSTAEVDAPPAEIIPEVAEPVVEVSEEKMEVEEQEAKEIIATPAAVVVPVSTLPIPTSEPAIEPIVSTEPLPTVESKPEVIIRVATLPSSPPPSESIYISGLVRPFTVPQLKELLNSFGDVTFFWIDTIKTHCYVTYSKLHHSKEAADSIKSLFWPVGSGKALSVDYVPMSLLSGLVAEEEAARSRLILNIVTPTSPDQEFQYNLTPLAPLPSTVNASLPTGRPEDFKPPSNAPTGPKVLPDPKPANRPNFEDNFNLTESSPRIYWCERGGGKKVIEKESVQEQELEKEAAIVEPL